MACLTVIEGSSDISLQKILVVRLADFGTGTLHFSLTKQIIKFDPDELFLTC